MAITIGMAIINLTGCIAVKDIVLPTTTQREMAQAEYRQCITQVTNKIYDNTTPAEEIVRASFANCQGARQSMLQSYPKRWHDHMANKIDEEIYQEEMAYIQNRRN